MADNELTVTTTSLPGPMVTVQQWAERRQAFNGWVNTQLHEGVDFGQIPGTDKPSLLKPGAEKIVQLYGCSVEVETVRREQDVATGYLYVEVVARAVSIQSGQVVGTGLGACSSFESRYRWRWEWWNAKGTPTEPGWEEFRRKSGTLTWRKRIANRDLFDQWNTVLKMAKKRALVDMALTISGASEMFTQDVEDLPQGQAGEGTETGESGKAGGKQDPKPTPQPQTGSRLTEHWTKYQAERDAFGAWREKHTLSDVDCKRLAGAYDGKPPLKLFSEFPGTREELQNAIEAQMAREQAPTVAMDPNAPEPVTEKLSF